MGYLVQNKEKYISNAIQWAENQLGSTEYQTRCLAFVEDAYEISNGIEIFGGSTAKESGDEYGASNSIGVPPKGAFVFYNCFGNINNEHKNWGHVGLSIGDNKVIHAWDVVRIEHFLDIEKLDSPPGWTSPEYIGWSPIEKIFENYRMTE